jgi:DMSO/TMAO reductase YedYZ molybdopterin-dependent catalytic subunit
MQPKTELPPGQRELAEMPRFGLLKYANRFPSETGFVIFRCQDGYRISLPLGDLMSPDVILADEIDGQPLSIKHGAPLRLVAPAHYGYKSPKHIKQIEFWRDERNYRPAGFAFMEHPRGRVANEERGRIFPGWLLRYLYRPLINPVKRRFAAALAALKESAE